MKEKSLVNSYVKNKSLQRKQSSGKIAGTRGQCDFTMDDVSVLRMEGGLKGNHGKINLAHFTMQIILCKGI